MCLNFSFENLTERYRWEGVAALITHLESLNGTVIIQLSPVGFVFTMPLVGVHYTQVYSLIGQMHSLNKDNLEHKSAYAREIRRAKVKKADPQARLFGIFDEMHGGRARSIPSLSSGTGYLEFYRTGSYGFDKKHEPAVRNYLEKLFSQLGHWAFVSYPESEQVADFEWVQYSFDYRLLAGMPGSMAFSCDSEAQYEALVCKVIAELKRSVARLEEGMPFDIELVPICRIKAPLGFYVIKHFDKSRTVEILSYRARLVRLLGWPIYFHKVQQDLPRFREQWPELVAAPPPYDPIHELECYLNEMLALFPVLGEDPFAVDG